MPTYDRNFIGPIPSPNLRRTLPTTPYTQLPSVQQPTRNLEFQSGNPVEIQNQGQAQTSGLGNELQGVMDLLKRAQTMGLNTQRGAEQEQVNRGSAPLPTDLASAQLSPSQILGFKRGEQQAVEPTIGGARSLVDEADKLLNDYKTQQDSIRKQNSDFINKLIADKNATGLESLLKNKPELFKAAGIDAGAVQTILPSLKELEASKDIIYSIQDVGGRTIRFGFDKQGNVISQTDLGKSTQTAPDTELLSPSEAQLLQVPYGTTKGEAAQKGIISQPKLSPQAQTNKVNAESGLRALQTIKDELFDENGNVKENVLVRKSFFGMARNYKAALNEASDILTRLRTGAALNESEVKFYVGQLPKVGDNKQTIINKLKRFEQIFNDIAKNPGPGRTSGTEMNETVSFTPNGTSRTDRHNNPTAFTTDIAKLAGLKEGVDYAVGDSFSGGKYHTAKLLGDPIATTIKVIDKIGFYTPSGGRRWTHTAISKANWDRLSFGQKLAVIDQMYKKENGAKSDIRRFA